MSDNGTSSLIKADGQEKTSMTWAMPGVHSYIKIFIIGVLFYLVFQNEIRSIVRQWVTDPSWSHGFLIPLFSLYFINQSKNEILLLNTRPNYTGLFFLIFGIVFYFLNTVVFHYGYLNPLSAIGTLGAIVLFLGGWKLIRYTWLPISFLIFAVPLPQRYYVMVTMPMRKLASTITAALLSLVGSIEANSHGVIIDVFYKGQPVESALNVAEACSGMRLLMAFLALGVAMAYLHYRPVWQRLILLATTVPIAVLCNVVRVTITGFLYILVDPKYTKGIYHDGLGMLMLPLAFGLYGFLAWFMSNLFAEEMKAQEDEDVIVRKR